MNKIDFGKIHDSLDIDTCLRKWLPGGKISGINYFVKNPRRNDKTPGSFSVNRLNGKWADFAGDSTDKGGDLVSLYAYLFHANDNIAAAKELISNNGINMDAPIVPRKMDERVRQLKDAQPTPIIPVPAEATAPNFKHFKFGEPAAVWTYRGTAGDVLMYIARYDTPDGKEIIPWSWCDHPGKQSRWTMRGISGDAKRPIYGLPELAENPEADAVIVEGEKSKDAAQKLLGDAAVAASWMGGGATADKIAGLKAFEGRRVILFPDFDAQTYKDTHPRAGELMDLHEQPGMRAMMKIATNLRGIAREILMVGYRFGEHAPGWDIADALEDGWSGERLLKFIGANSRDPWHVPVEDDNLHIDASVNPFGYPHITEKGQPMNTVENLRYMMDEYGVTAKYNEVRKKVEINIPSRAYTVDNRDNCGLAELISISSRNRLPSGNLGEFIKLTADANAYSPVRDWIKSKPWDGKPRIDALMNTITVADDPSLKNKLVYRWMISAIAAVFMQTGFTSHGVLVFTGPQGQGKTSWVKSLVPAHMGVVLEGAAIDPNNKDTVINAVSHWLVEMGELDATFRKADIARLKSFVTQAVDKLRRPYDRIESEYRRSTVFFASVNEGNYLVDDTGNRRWWTVPVTGINFAHGIDMQQVWAELLTHFKRGEQHWLTSDEQNALNALNEDHEAIDPVEEIILKWFDWSVMRGSGFGYQEMTATDVLTLIGYDKPNKSQATHASKVLKKLCGGAAIKRASGRFFSVPPSLKRARHVDAPGESPI